MTSTPVTRDLGSGVTLYVETSPVLPIVSIIIALRSGSAHDPPGREGLARITARMLRRGCAGLDANAIEQSIDRLGAEFGADVAVSSSSVAGQVLTRNLGAFVDLLTKLLGSPTFDEQELGRLIRESRAELLESLDNDRGLAERFFRRAVFPEHGYGRTSRGTKASLDAIDRAQVVRHHAQHYTRGNVVIAMAGDVEPEEAERLARKLLLALPEGPVVADPLGEPAPTQGRHLVFVDKPERTQTQILIGALGTSPHDPDHVSLTVANSIFGGTFTSRLTREVRGKRGWSYGASSRLGVDRHRYSFVMWTFPSATDAAACIKLELELFEKLLDKGVTDREVRFIQRYLTRSWAFEVDTAQKRVHQSLDVEILNLPKDYYTQYLEHIANVTSATANEALRTRLRPQDLYVCVVGTAADILPSIQKSIDNLAGTDVVTYDIEAKG